MMFQEVLSGSGSPQRLPGPSGGGGVVRMALGGRGDGGG